MIALPELIANLEGTNSSMKTKIAATLLAVSALFMTSCEQQRWEDTKTLFESHGHHGDDHGHADKAHGDAAHGEKKAEAKH